MPRPMIATLALLTVSTAFAVEPPELPSPPESRTAWKPQGDLADLLAKMRAACASSAATFRPLSAEQMNWRPPNGTHTPRWNAEHMMARQLLFFSQIYAAVDPERHEVVDLNPAQMPPDYAPAHPEWTGADEADWMLRVSDYVQGHAYLLQDLDLDAKAPGSRWKLRALLKQMDRHYHEHTANVRKKFDLPEWPAR